MLVALSSTDDVTSVGADVDEEVCASTVVVDGTEDELGGIVEDVTS